LGCADSRIAPEYAFDSSHCDLFVCRVVCNFIADNLASVEFAVDALKFPLLLVLRHEACGAIKATMSSVQDGVRPWPFAFAGRRAGAGDHRRTRRFAGERNTRNRPPKRRVPDDRNADSQRPDDEGRLKVIGEIYRLATGRVELIG
jgi:carbonic anhydrase